MRVEILRTDVKLVQRKSPLLGTWDLYPPFSALHSNLCLDPKLSGPTWFPSTSFGFVLLHNLIPIPPRRFCMRRHPFSLLSSTWPYPHSSHHRKILKNPLVRF